MNGKLIINKFKAILGMELKLAQMLLVDGVTTVEAESFEPGMPVYIVTDGAQIAMPIGQYELEDGKMLTVNEEGIIASVEDAPTGEENPAEQMVEPAEVEMEQSAPAKKTVESVVKETYFEKIEEQAKQIIELKAELEKLKQEKETVELSIEEPVKPIVHNPEPSVSLNKSFFPSNPNSRLERIFKHINENKK